VLNLPAKPPLRKRTISEAESCEVQARKILHAYGVQLANIQPDPFLISCF
jgi:hypothetical protein